MRTNRKPPIPPHAYVLRKRQIVECSTLIRKAMPIGFRLPAAFDRFQVITLKTDKTLDRTDLELLTRGLDAFSHQRFSSLNNVLGEEINLTFTRGSLPRLNEIIVIGKFPKATLFRSILISEDPTRVGRSDR